MIAVRHGAFRNERDTFDDTLRRLSFDRIIPKEVADVFHALRKIGNVAAHEAKGGHADAPAALSSPVRWASGSIAPMTDSRTSTPAHSFRRRSRLMPPLLCGRRSRHSDRKSPRQRMPPLRAQR
ncbi:MAG: DUF4145 domain-containing protein [Rhizobiaceae bacterium]